jgi:NADH-quinone oxidoreductase subunit N
MQNANMTVLLPEALLLVAALLTVLNDAFTTGASGRRITYGIALLSSLVATVWYAALATEPQVGRFFSDMYVVDQMASVLKAFVCLGFALTLLYSRRYLVDRDLDNGNIYMLGMFSLLGQIVMISGNNLLTLYLGLEMMSLSLYALIALRRDDSTSGEASMKYYVLGALASGFTLYGISMMYGATSSLDLGEISRTLASGRVPNTVLLFGVVFIVVGVAFKLGTAPFHMWVPDVYQGSPTAMSLLVAAGPKVAAFAFGFRLLVDGMLPLANDWQQMLTIVAALSMIIGNVMGLVQTNIKRLLAYSAISNQGFVLLGLIGGVVNGNGDEAASAYGSAMFYSVIYLITTVAVFGVLLILSRKGVEADNIDDLKGLNQRSPWTAFVMLVLMFSLAGIPPTAGFYAKLSVLSTVVNAGMIWLSVLGVLSSLVGAFYYLRIVKVMYFDTPLDDSPVETHTVARVLLTLNGLAVLALGIFPGPLLNVCLHAMHQLFGA